MSPTNQEQRVALFQQLSHCSDRQIWRRAAEKHRGWEQPGDPILLALRLFGRVQEYPEALQDELRRLTPAHAHYLEDPINKTLGFPRLVVEGARRDGLSGSKTGLSSIKQARRALSLLEDSDSAGLRSLQILATAYLGAQLRAQKEYVQGREYLKEAYESLDHETDDEVRATVLQLWAEQLRDRGEAPEAKGLLEEAVEKLDLDHIPGRKSELLLILAKLYLVTRDPASARPLLLEALRLCPRDRALITRFEVLHYLTAAEVGLRLYDEAKAHYDGAEEFSSYGHQELNGQRFWIKGHLALETGFAAEAEKPFLTALGIFQGLGRFRDATKALIGLAEVYWETGRLGEKEQEIAKHFANLTCTGELTEYSRERLERLRIDLGELGIEISELDDLIRQLKPVTN